jgi:hypothetical protein
MALFPWTALEKWLDAAGLFLEKDLEHQRGDIQFKDKDLHQQAIAAAKAKFKVWPSAYASGYMVQKYKELYKQKHGSGSGFKGDDGDVAMDDLDQWFKEEWVRIGANGEIIRGMWWAQRKRRQTKVPAKGKGRGNEQGRASDHCRSQA